MFGRLKKDTAEFTVVFLKPSTHAPRRGGWSDPIPLPPTLPSGSAATVPISYRICRGICGNTSSFCTHHGGAERPNNLALPDHKIASSGPESESETGRKLLQPTLFITGFASLILLA